MAAGRHTARQIAEGYLARIEAIDRSGPTLRSVIETNPDALDIADALDRERREKGPRGPLHGIPILLKDNIDTADRMMTTAGSLALVGPAPERDAFLVERLRAAGAVILGKTNLSEWANFRSTKSASGWSARGGLVRNPYALDRNACGSSSGTGTAISANLAVAGVGTETDGSIVCPSSITGLVGVKPTLGLVSRSGHRTGRAQPGHRRADGTNRRDAAILLGATTGVDPRDKRHAPAAARRVADYTCRSDRGWIERRPHRRRAKAVLRLQPRDRPAHRDRDRRSEGSRGGASSIRPTCRHAGEYEEGELEVLLYEFKADLNAYLATRKDLQVRTLKDLIAFNERERDREMPFFGQELFEHGREEGAADRQGLSERARQKPPLERPPRHRRRHGQASARRDCHADGEPGVDDRSRQRRSFPRRQLDAGGGRGLSESSRFPPASRTACRSGCRSSAAPGPSRRCSSSRTRTSRRRSTAGRRHFAPRPISRRGDLGCEVTYCRTAARCTRRLAPAAG